MSSARNRQRRSGRRPPFRDPKPIILIVCEGEKTEKQYFLGFDRACRNSRVKVKVAKEHGVPRTLVEIAKEYKREAEEKAAREEDLNLAMIRFGAFSTSTNTQMSLIPSKWPETMALTLPSRIRALSCGCYYISEIILECNPIPKSKKCWPSTCRDTISTSIMRLILRDTRKR